MWRVRGTGRRASRFARKGKCLRGGSASVFFLFCQLLKYLLLTASPIDWHDDPFNDGSPFSRTIIKGQENV
jgi:hypothetical protein